MLARLVTTAMGVERGVAVRAQDPEVLEPVVVVDAVDVVQDERHPAAAPELALAADLALWMLQAFGEQPALQVTAVIRGPLDEHVAQRNRFAGCARSRPSSEVIDRNAPGVDVLSNRPVVAARSAQAEPPQGLSVRPRVRDCAAHFLL